MLNVGEKDGGVAFLGYRQHPDGSKGPSETKNLIRRHGDIIIAVNGRSTVKKTFKEVIPMLKESQTFAYMRLVHQECMADGGSTTSCGPLGRYLRNDLSTAFRTDRRRLLAKRSLALIRAEGKDGESTSSDDTADELDDDSESDESADIEPDSEDEALLQEKSSSSDDSSNSTDDSRSIGNAPFGNTSDTEKNVASQGAATENKASVEEKETNDHIEALKSESVTYKQESTRHLAYKILGIDVGYSSDEGGDEDIAYYVDGVDSTFTCANKISLKSLNEDKESVVADSDCNETSLLTKLPLKKTDFSISGKRTQLQVAIALTSQEPDIDDFDNYPFPSSKQIAAEKQKLVDEAKKAEEEARKIEEQKQNEAAALQEAAKPRKKSTIKVEQISSLTSEVVRIWANAEDASTTLQISLEAIQTLLRGIYDAELGDEIGGYRWRYADADAVVTEKASSGRDSKKGRDAYLQFREKLYDPKVPHMYKNENRLRDYQVDGVNWLSSCYYKRVGCILADEMGLGKTVQIVSYLEHLYRVEKMSGPFLVVVPLSTVEHWRREFEGWTDMQCCVYHDRQRVWRDVLREYEWYYEDRPHTPDYLKFNVLVTTYDTLIGDFDVIGDVPWRVAVVDEAHRLRNIKGKLLECMKEISAKGTLKYGYQSRVLMTGTPLQNNTQELWTLLNFIEPTLFRSMEEFDQNFGNMANREQVEALQRKISPFMLRRVKEDVAKDIPAKEETVIDVELTSIQKQYYRAIFEHNHAFLSMGSKATAPKLMNIQMELRKCCNHPFLLDGVESREMEKRHEILRHNGELDDKSPEQQHEILNHYGYVLSSGKMVLLDKLLPKLRAEGHKVLIFSQFVKMLDLISDYCEFRDFRYERLDGRVRGNERQKAIDRFETEKDSFMFLLSTRAGGVGINLTAADICIIYDSDWNPQNDVQAQARCHRIGQTKDVMIYRLVTSRTFEQEMFDRASKKLGLEQAILGTFGQDNDDDKPTSKEMEQLLKRGAYALLEDENDDIGKEFVADDIESILEKRTRTRVVEGAKTASWLNKKGMNVTKSKFASESESAGIDVDDPLFWQKVMPDFVTPKILLNRINEMEEDFEKPVKGHPKTSKTTGENGPKSLSRGKQKKVNEFMADLKGVMEDIFEQDRGDALDPSEKATCQKLLLCISLKHKLFNENQRATAQKMLDSLDGDRRRKCRTSNIGIETNDEAFSAPSIRKELLIVSSKKKRIRGRKQSKEEDDESDSDDERKQKKKKSPTSELLDEDGFLKHSDDEGEWSDVDDDIYKSGKKSISMKELKRRREWGAGKDPVKLASMPWPVFPRNILPKVLATLLDEVIKIDKANLGIFCVPVPKDQFPAYYELIKQPMDYGTMKIKLDRGDYRSAQAMQKDFALVNANCLQFNAQDSDIVREAQRQTLMRPKLLKEAALKNLLFICDDGSVIDVHDDDTDKVKKGKTPTKPAPKKPTPKKPTGKLVACGECEGCKRKACKKCNKCLSKRRCVNRLCINAMMVDEMKPSGDIGPKNVGTDGGDTSDDADEQDAPKPKIRIRISSSKNSAAKSSVKRQGSKRKAAPKKSENGSKRKKAKHSHTKAPPSSSTSSSEGSDDDQEDEGEPEEMFDVVRLQSESEKLNGTWEAARNFATKLGPWRLPAEIESKFKDIAKITLSIMSR
jgi:SNF2 family DNA or RNA helicase